MTTCPDCQRLAREVEILRRIDYRACEDKARELLAHQTTTHIFHVAVPPQPHPQRVKNIDS